MRKLVDKHGDKSWVLVASFLPNRTGKQIRERWHNQLDPHIMKGPWTEDEDMLIMEAQKIHGNRWAEIAKLVRATTPSFPLPAFSFFILLCQKHWASIAGEREAAASSCSHPMMIRSSLSETCLQVPGRTDNAIKNRWNSTIRSCNRPSLRTLL